MTGVRSLRARLLMVAGAALLPLLIASFLARREMVAHGQVEAQANAVRLSAVAAGRHADVLREAAWVLSALARSFDNAALGEGSCRELFGDFYDARDHYSAFGIALPDGRPVCQIPSGEPRDLGEREYFRTAVQSRRLTMSDYQVGLITGRPIVAMAVPAIGPDSTVEAVLAAGVDLGSMRALPPDVTLPVGSHLTVVDRQGVVLLHAPDDLPAAGDTLPAEIRNVLDTHPGDTILDLMGEYGEPRTYAFTPVETEAFGVPAYVFVSFDPAWLAGQIAGTARWETRGVAISVLLLIAGVWLAVEFLILRRLAPIVSASERLGSGDLGARTGAPGRNDEIGRLAGTFDEMAESLETLQRKQAESARQRLRASEERLRVLSEVIDEVFWTWDSAERSYAYVSPPFDEIWGFSRQRLMERPQLWFESIHPDDRAQVRKRLDPDGRLPEGEYEYRIVRPDGEERWILSRTFAVPGGEDGETRYVGVAHDITDRKTLEDALLQANKLEAVGRLAGGVAHDFNNVLTAIQGHAQLAMADLDPDDPMSRDLTQIEIAAQRGTALTRQLLMFGRKQAIRPQVLDLNEVIRDTTEMIGRLIGEDIRLEVDLGATDPIEADPHQIEQVLVNLAVNARDAMPRGGSIRIETGSVTVREREVLPTDVLEPGRYAVMRITDTGTGMTPEVLEHVFEPFFTTKALGEGTGLGLATVYGIVKQSGGSLRVDSAEGEGTTFEVYLPPAGSEVPAPVPTEPDEPVAEASGTVLLVEDEEGVRAVVGRMLNRMGYEVVEVASALEALDVLHDHRAIDVLLTDVVMPGMTGLELREALRSERPELPAVFMSGYPNPGTGGPDPEVPGAVHYLQKPFSRAELARALTGAIENP